LRSSLSSGMVCMPQDRLEQSRLIAMDGVYAARLPGAVAAKVKLMPRLPLPRPVTS
jgi:hypothetical protein